MPYNYFKALTQKTSVVNGSFFFYSAYQEKIKIADQDFSDFLVLLTQRVFFYDILRSLQVSLPNDRRQSSHDTDIESCQCVRMYMCVQVLP